MIRITAKERILLHLWDYAKYAEAVEVPTEMTQAGIASATWIDTPHFSQYVRPLMREDLVRERVAHVRGERRRRKVYDLTVAGRMRAVRLRDQVKSGTLQLRSPEGVRDASVAEVIAEAGGRASVLDVLRHMTAHEVVDVTALVAPRHPQFVEMLTDAPRLGRFVGRRAELDSVTQDGNGPRVFVVQGVAGIGKSSFASKACELLRGRRNLFWHRVRTWDTHQAILAHIGGFLLALGRPGLQSVLARGEAFRAAEVLREDLAGTRPFFVFDDAHEGTPEVLSFLRFLKDAIAQTEGVRALVLTRRALSFYDRRDVAISGLVREIELVGLGSEDVATLLSTKVAGSTAIPFGRHLAGHPLFLELVVARAEAPSQALRDVRRFIEEEIYTKLSEPERRMMKTASLYQVPVPREALFPEASLSHDVFISLVERSLIRPMSEEAFGVHDTIREFFATVLTPQERQSLSGYAIQQLLQLASEARKFGNFVACIDCLSNALLLSTPGKEQVALGEALGDANERIGDLPAALVGYKEALKLPTETVVRARLHRKTASALQNRSEIASASGEIEEAFRALGATHDVERGWIDLVKCRIATQLNEWEEAREHGEAALRTFRAFAVPLGQAQALLELGNIALHSPNGDPAVAGHHLTAALALSDSISDFKVIADLHTLMSHLCSHHHGDVDGAMDHVAAIEALPEVGENLPVHRSLLMLKGNLNLHFRGDFPAARANFMEAMAVARKVHDPSTIAEAKQDLAWIPFYEGRIDEARREFEQNAIEMRALGFPARTVDSMFKVAECCMLQGDIVGFHRVMESLNDPGLSQGVETHLPWIQVLRGIDCLLRGDVQGMHDAFAPALLVENMPYPLYSHFFYGIALRALGREADAKDHIRRAREILEGYSRKPALAAMADTERRLTDVLRRAI